MRRRLWLKSKLERDRERDRDRGRARRSEGRVGKGTEIETRIATGKVAASCGSRSQRPSQHLLNYGKNNTTTTITAAIRRTATEAAATTTTTLAERRTAVEVNYLLT